MFLLIYFKQFNLFIAQTHTNNRMLPKQLPATRPCSPSEISTVPLCAVQRHIVMAFFTHALIIELGIREFFIAVQRFGKYFINKKAADQQAQQQGSTFEVLLSLKNIIETKA